MANLFRANKKGGGGIQVESLTVTTMPTKTTYAQYDSVDLTGAVITATFPDGVTANVTNAVDISPSILSNTGSQTVTLSYGGATATFNVTVNAMTSIAVTTMPTKTSYQPNEALDLTGIVVTGTAGAITSNITAGCTFNPADGTILSEEGTIPVTVTYHGLTTSFNVTCSTIPASLEDATWAQIQAAAQNGTLSQFASVGDTKTIAIGSYTYHMQLASINDGTGTAGTYYPNGTADFIAVELLPDTHAMNTTNTNAGGWNDCNMRTYLNNTIYLTLPSDLRAVIVEKTHMRTAGNQSTSLVSASDKLWLPTEWEMFGSATYGGESATYNKHYSIFPDASSRIKKIVGSTSAYYWWESSPQVNGNTYFSNVGTGGGGGASLASSSIGVALCLRIG